MTLLVAAAIATPAFSALAPDAKPRRDRTPPRLTSTLAADGRVTLTFREGLVPRGVDRRAFIVTVNESPVTVTSAAVGARQVTLAIDARFLSDDVVSVTYLPADVPRGRRIRDRAGNAVRRFSLRDVRNAAPTGCSRWFGTASAAAASEGPTNSDLFMRSVGTVKVVVLHVDFSDSQPSRFERPTFVDRISSWFADQSYGRLRFEVQHRGEWLRMPRTAASYGDDGRDLLADAVAEAAARGVDMRSAVVLVGPPLGSRFSSRTTNRLFTSRPGGGIPVQGGEVRFGAIGRGVLTSVQQPVQLALLAGIPNVSGKIGNWDAVSAVAGAGVPGLIAWHRRKLGWLDPAQIRCVNPGETLEEALSPLATPGGVEAILVPTGVGQTGFVIENRQRIGHDSGFCRRGVLVYLVDPRSQTTPLTLRPATSSDDQNATAQCGSYYGAPFAFDEPSRPTWSDPSTKLDLRLLAETDGSYRVRIARR